MLRTNIGASTGLGLLCVLLSGCFHQQAAAPVPSQAKTPNIYVPPPQQADLPPMSPGTPPADVTEAKPVIAEETKPKKKTKKPVTVTPAPVVAVVSPPPSIDPPQPDSATLGALGSGENANPKQQQDVAAMISTVEKRLTDLSALMQDHEQKQIAKVRLFNKEASDALKGGDVDGARILATKAELLLDDLTKQ